MYYTPSGQRKKSAKIIVLGAVTNLCLNLLLIPKLGATGATTASITAESVITILYVQISKGFLTWKTMIKLSYKRIIAGIIMCIVVYMIGKWLLSISDVFVVIIQVVCGLLVYGTILLIEKDTMAYELIEICKSYINRIKNRIYSNG